MGSRARRRAARTAPALAALVAGWLGAAAPAQGQLATRGLLYAPASGPAEVDTVAPPLDREFRAVWVAAVSNIDWPSRPGLSTEQQQRELRAILDRSALLHLNAVILQVRPSADALYESRLEPWSYFLTGEMGRAPEPYYDPLAFAVEEAHKRGLELHAWFNPYRAKHPDDVTRTLPRQHVSRRLPSLVKKYGKFLWMDPGEPEIRRLTTRVVLDVVQRYDVDGVHIDDYFYPYPERARRRGTIPFPDDRSWRAYVKGGGKLSRDDWRRDNVDRLVRELYQGIKKTKPWVKFGISPFGIWRPGSPPSVTGLDAYSQLFADSRKWLNEGWLDYWTPQLYWRLSAPQQSYTQLLAWWISQNSKGRNVWPGNFTGRASHARSTIWPASEIVDQIRATREQLGPLSGNVHFSGDAFRVDRDSLVERLVAGPYAAPALVPPSPWLASAFPATPRATRTDSPVWVELAVEETPLPEGEVRPAGGSPARGETTRRQPQTGASTASRESSSRELSSDPRWWVVRARYAEGWRAVVSDAAAPLVRLLPDTGGVAPTSITVSAVDRAGLHSAPLVVR